MARLQGMKDITKYAGYSETTILKMIRLHDFPASFVGGVWISDTVLVDNWFITMILNDPVPGRERGQKKFFPGEGSEQVMRN